MKRVRVTKEIFIERSKLIHGDKYTLLLTKKLLQYEFIIYIKLILRHTLLRETP